MTKRVIKTMETPNVNILAYPTCWPLPNREPVEIDIMAVFQTAFRTNTMLEINTMPNRPDFRDTHTYQAKELIVKLAINTDAHSTEHFGFMRFGEGRTRRGWCQAKDIINTMPLDERTAYLKLPKE
ncbi:hypothetical protein ACFLUQ_01735 [Chloroflexota bacterium]